MKRQELQAKAEAAEKAAERLFALEEKQLARVFRVIKALEKTRRRRRSADKRAADARKLYQSQWRRTKVAPSAPPPAENGAAAPS